MLRQIDSPLHKGPCIAGADSRSAGGFIAFNNFQQHETFKDLRHEKDST